MKFAKFLTILTFVHLNVHGADYPRPQYSGKKTPSDFSKLPAALLSEAQPVDPFCVGRVLMQPRGTGQALTECAGTAKDVQRYVMFTSHAEKKRFIAAEATINNQELGYIHQCSAQYEVQGVLGTKAIIKTQYECDEEKHMTLGIVEQKNNQLFNAGVILEGDVDRFDYVSTMSFEKGILRYSVSSPASSFLDTVLNQAPQDKSNPLIPDYLDHTDFFGWIHLTLDLNKNEYPFKPEVTGVRFRRPVSLGYPETTTKNCLSKTIDKFITDQDSSIPAGKFSAFRTEVNQCIGPQLPAPKKDRISEPGKLDHI